MDLSPFPALSPFPTHLRKSLGVHVAYRGGVSCLEGVRSV